MELERLLALTKKYIRGEASAEEKALLDEWYYAFQGKDLPVPAGAGARVKKTLRAALFPRPVKYWYWGAAVFFLLATGFFTLRPAGHTIRVPVAARTFQLLPDSSKLWVNALSTVSYRKAREVGLEGEAFFDVAHDPLHPFTIRVRGVTVTVLGTAFNIKAYPGEPVVVTVTRGKVKVAGYGHTALVTPGGQVVVSDSVCQQQGVQPVLFENWKEGVLQFTDERFGAIASTLERRYGAVVEFSEDSLRGLRFTAGFDSSRSLEAVLDALSKVNGTHWQKGNNGHILVTP